MKISTSHKDSASRCDEEISHYLVEHIEKTWSVIFHNDKAAMAKVDSATVRALELKAPWAFTADAKIIRNKVLSGEIFQNFIDQERERILRKYAILTPSTLKYAKSTPKRLMPSLITFHKDVALLYAISDCLKWLVSIGSRDTLRTAIEGIYTGVNQIKGLILIQETESRLTPMPAGSSDIKNLGYRTLCAYALRHHREIPQKPSGRIVLAKPPAAINTKALRNMADLAYQLGFESPEIEALRQYSKDESEIGLAEPQQPLLVTDDCEITSNERCGIPLTSTYEEDRKYLFLRHLHDGREEQGKQITSMFRLRCWYLSFFGVPEQDDAVQAMISCRSTATSNINMVSSPPSRQPTGDEPSRDTPMQDIPEQLQQYLSAQNNEAQEHLRQLESEKLAKLEGKEQEINRQRHILEEQIRRHAHSSEALARSAALLKEQEEAQFQKQLKLEQDANSIQAREHEQKQRLSELNKSGRKILLKQNTVQQQEEELKTKEFELERIDEMQSERIAKLKWDLDKIRRLEQQLKMAEEFPISREQELEDQRKIDQAELEEIQATDDKDTIDENTGPDL
ncbi:MAG: hypothetical protein Q9187_004044 [Circinaria calcarea]